MGELEVPGADPAQKVSGFGSAHPGVDAFGAFGGAENANQAVQAEIVAGSKNVAEVVLERAACTETLAESFGFSAASVACERGRDTGTASAP
ncbi:hypothetical protein GCM10009840_21010 [Pseudolysinimonas kribbensis]|uniref:Uncharacterized protein n=1 Tax=Pseudolysinimonas kribbensis TaxID=433641 RepID=A0ABQ6JYA4_9MICO|nr:hypothetical protein [Pseudolysinimonas kribbensis]GMA93296.1 hypothetical protein GCM10025881_01200 [Pseudolysinimonas kribbensis]GMA97198.1 hypothetical protein GCM10025881_40220 [Pseudolysinimonas kribbensis]